MKMPGEIKRILCGFVVAGLFMGSGTAWAIGDASKVAIPQMQYEGGNHQPRPDALESLLAQLAKRTSVEVKRESLDLKPADNRLFRYPILYMGGDQPFDPLTSQEAQMLRQYLTYGGFLIIDDNSAQPDSGFDASARKMIAQLFPHTPMQKISNDHSIFRSFYLLNEVTGRIRIHPYLEGITLKGRTVLVYSANDLGGAWSKNKLGHYDFDMIGGGPRQRTLSIRLGINIILYALTLDYKKDLVHLPIILERLRRYNAR